MKLAKPLMISFSLLAFAGAAYANEGVRQGGASQGQSSEAASASAGASQQQGQMRANQLIGMDVTDRQGQDLGEIKEIVLDLQNGRVHAAVVEFGGVLGLGEKQYAFPISQLSSGAQGEKLVLDVDKDKLQDAAGFAQGQWPAMDDEYWGRVGGQASAGQTGSRGQGQKMTLVRASELEGKNVQDKRGQEVGEIKDVVVDLNSGQMRHIIIDRNEGGETQVQANALTMGTGDRYVISN